PDSEVLSLSTRPSQICSSMTTSAFSCCSAKVSMRYSRASSGVSEPTSHTRTCAVPPSSLPAALSPPEPELSPDPQAASVRLIAATAATPQVVSLVLLTGLPFSSETEPFRPVGCVGCSGWQPPPAGAVPSLPGRSGCAGVWSRHPQLAGDHQCGGTDEDTVLAQSRHPYGHVRADDRHRACRKRLLHGLAQRAIEQLARAGEQNLAEVQGGDHWRQHRAERLSCALQHLGLPLSIDAGQRMPQRRGREHGLQAATAATSAHGT